MEFASHGWNTDETRILEREGEAMSEASSRRPKLIGCQVAVFPIGDAGKATIGYYGTIVGRWNDWTYWVLVPSLGGAIAVRDWDLLIVQEATDGNHLITTQAWHLAERRWEIEFESLPEADNTVLRGKYRIGSVAKGRFKFEKSNLPALTFFLRMPAKATGSSRSKLNFKVPTGDVLDRAYVMKALAEVLHQELPSAEADAVA